MTNPHPPQIPIAILEQIDDICLGFEAQWRADKSPAIEPQLPEEFADPERVLLLTELLALEVHYRRQHGENPRQEDYQRRFPNAADAVRQAFTSQETRKAPFSPPSAADLAPLFPALEILELLGAGGMGAVYKARQPGLDRIVALKILPEEFGNDTKSALRFTREARTLAKLNHPHIVTVHEFGTADSTYYFLMEYIDGPTLRDVIGAGELSPQQALTIVPRLCEALQFAHENGVIHRDIKPENILLTRDGVVKIADFGLSGLLDQGTQSAALTAIHQILGTPRYMAPEQMTGTRDVDHRADIYSLGVVFYEMLTGELPVGRFEAPSRKVSIDIRLDDVVLRTLEQEPARRYQSAGDVKSEVEGIAARPNAATSPTVIAASAGDIPGRTATISLNNQELAARLLLSRQDLMERLRRSLQPLFRGQLLQLAVGIVLVAIGARCWAGNTGVLSRLVSGLTVHGYGVIVIGTSIAMMARIRRINYAGPLSEIRTGIEGIRKLRLWFGPVIGFPWWLLWLPVAVCLGLDIVLHPNCLIPSLILGIPGILVFSGLYAAALRTKSPDWRDRLAGGCLSAARHTLTEIEKAGID